MTQIHQRSVGDRYVVLTELGRDPARSVWRGRDRVTGSQVAIKVLRPELFADPAALGELRHTLDLVARLEHPGILNVAEVVMFGDRVALVGELLHGESLRSLLAAKGPLPRNLAVSVMAGLCRALAAAHAVGVTHGALTPSRLLLEPDRPAPGRVLLADFGMAALVNRAAAADRLQPPPTTYLAPEISRGQPGTAAADVYSIGALLYEALSGRPPSGTPQHDAVATVADPGSPAATPPSAGLPIALWQAIQGCLAPDPDLRPSAEQFAEQLDGFTSPAPRPALPTAAASPGDNAAEVNSTGPGAITDGTTGNVTAATAATAPQDDYTSLFLPAIRPDATVALRPDFGRSVTADPSDERAPAATTRRRVAQVTACVAVLAALVLLIGFTLGKPDRRASVAGDAVPVLAGSGTGWPSATYSAPIVPSSSQATTSPSAASPPPAPGTRAVAGGSTPNAGSVATSPTPVVAPSSTTPTSKASASSGTTTPTSRSLKNAYSGTCLATDGPYTNGTVEAIWSCGVSGIETWTLTATGTLPQDGGRYCLDDYSYGARPGTEVDLWSCNGGSNQQWTLRSDGSIVGVYSRLCLDIAGPSPFNGSAIQLQTCDDQSSQHWSWTS